MKPILTFALCLLPMLGTLRATDVQRLEKSQGTGSRWVISLDGEWQVAEGAMDRQPESFPHTVRVPGILVQAKPPLESVKPRAGEGMAGKRAEKRSPERNAFWYRRTIKLDKPLPDVAWLTVAKARWGVKAWVNGAEAGEHMRIRTAGRFDVRNHLKGGGAENEIVLRIGATQNEVPPDIPAFSAWTGNMPGLYDSVSLTLCDSPHVVRAQAVPDVKAKSVKLAVTLKNTGGSEKKAELAVRIVEDRSGKVAANGEGACAVAAGGEAHTDLVVAIPNARLWYPKLPNLYRFEIEVRCEGRATDVYADRFGMRTFAISPKTGRGLINGVPILLRGAGVLNPLDLFEHPDCGDKPWNEAWIRQALRNIKDVNGNAARFAFDHPPEIWYRIADEEGILIQDEAHSGAGGAQVTADSLAAEFTGWIHERANHPSVVIWDASNETAPDASKGRLKAAVAQVRHLDLSNRPWDNSWDPTGVPGDVCFELHPYLGWRANYSQSSFPAAAKGSDFAGEHQDVAVASLKPGFIINEFCGVMVGEDGSPSKLAKVFFDAFLTADATAGDRRLVRARFTAMETEYWRRVPGILGIMWNPYLHGSGRHVIADLATPALDPVFARFLRDASAPVSVMVDQWSTTIAPGSALEVPVSVSNDSPKPWSGEIRLRLLRAGKNHAKTSTFFEPPADDAALEKQIISRWQQKIGPVPLNQQRIATFTVPVPAEPGHFQVMAEITGEDGKPVRSWRDFKTAN